MRALKKLLTLGGLVVTTSPFCLAALAQGDFIDLEAEAAAREAAGSSVEVFDPYGDDTGSQAAPADPYGVQPAQSYPATTYGVGGTPAVGSVPGAFAAGPDAAPGSSAMGNLVLQVQQLQQEVMRLNGKVEEQANELRTLKDQSLQRYMDLDKRLSGADGASASAAAAATGTAAAAPAAPAPARPAPDSGGSAAAVQPGEKAAYDAAYSLVAGREFNAAVAAFRQFLIEYPGGRYAPNANYWLGELYLVSEPPDLEAARQAFALLISEYPEHPKVPDALYKLGVVQFMKGNREKAREYLDLVIAQYASSNSAVVKLARDYIAENY